jgi:hypothetical protein
MMYTLFPTYVLRDDGACIPLDEANADYQAYLAWAAEGNTPALPPPPTVDDIIGRFMPQLQDWMDGVAKQNGYDSVVSCATYATSSVAQWAADAAAIIAWRDAVWQWAYHQQPVLAAMTPEQIAGLTPEYIISQAPQASVFGWVVHAPGAPTS